MRIWVLQKAMRNETPEYISHSDEFPKGKKLVPGTLDYEYYHFTKQFQYEGVVASGCLPDQRVFYLKCTREAAKTLIRELPDLGSWHFSDDSGTSFRVDLVIVKC